MTAETPHPSAPEIENPRTPAAEFLYKVFDESETLLRGEKHAFPIVELGSQFIRRWNGNVFNMVKGLILRSDDYDYGLTMGVRGYNEGPDDRLTMEFGKIYHSMQSFDETLARWGPRLGARELTQDELKLNYLDVIVHQTMANYGSGRLYVNFGKVEVDCWTDKRIFGGREIGKLPYGEDQSIAGLKDYVDIVRQLVEKSWH